MKQTQDVGSVPGSGRFPGAGNGNPLQYSCLGNATDKGACEPMGSQRVRHDRVSELYVCTHVHAHTHILLIKNMREVNE